MYRTVAASFWTDPKVRQLTFDGKGLLLYYITNPHTHVSGIYVLPRVIIQHETSLMKSKLDTLCHTLSSLGFCAFDDSKDVVWVRKMMAYQGKGEKNLRSAAAHVAEDLHNSFLCKDFLDSYPAVRQYVAPSFIDTLSDTPSYTVSEFGTPDSRSRSRIQIPEQENGTVDERVSYGEHGHALLTPTEFQALGEKLNAHREDFIQQFDTWVHEAPDAKHAGVRRKDRNPYASICQWFSRAVKDGKVKPKATAGRPPEAEMDKIAMEMFGRKAR